MILLSPNKGSTALAGRGVDGFFTNMDLDIDGHPLRPLVMGELRKQPHVNGGVLLLVSEL